MSSTRRLFLATATSSALVTLSLLLAPGADATATRRFVIDSAADFSAGELDGTRVHAAGHLELGLAKSRVAIQHGQGEARTDEALAYAAVEVGDAVYVGTGEAGRIYRVRGDEATLFAETGALMVASLAASDDTLYAGTLPEGKVFAIPLSGEPTPRELVTLEETQHVWALQLAGSTLYAGSGPEGRVHAIDTRTGTATVWADFEAGHVLSLASGPEGSLFAGTSDDALVYRILGENRFEVVHDFPGNEIAALAHRDGVLAVVANEMPAPRTPTKSSSSSRPRPGKGRVYRVDALGRNERLLYRAEGHFTAVAIDDEGYLLIGGGREGKLFRASPDHEVSTLLDVDERQLLSVSATYVVTGDPAAFYRIESSAPTDAFWTSKVYDAGFAARWGRIGWRASGRVEVQTRSGNREEPDASWSDWSSVMREPGVVRSASARYVQVRIRLASADAVVRGVELFYLPQNQRPVLLGVGLDPSTTKNGARPSGSKLKIAWRVTNTDGDDLRYRLRYRPEGQTEWRVLTREDEVLTESNRSWETTGLPDGLYEIEVEASDELANPANRSLRHRAVSEPILVDNHAPSVERLRYRGGELSGRAIDSLGPITELAIALDGRRFLPILPSDGILDTAAEAFAVRLADVLPELAEGLHVVAVKAKDARGNTGVAELEVQVAETHLRTE